MRKIFKKYFCAYLPGRDASLKGVETLTPGWMLAAAVSLLILNNEVMIFLRFSNKS